jgi:hypothetical protein
MNAELIQDARWRHQDQQHPDPFEVCPDPVCRAATTAVNKENAIENMRKALKRMELERR